MGLANRLILFFHSHSTLPLYALRITPFASHFTLYTLRSSRERYGKVGNSLYTLRFTLYAGTGMRKSGRKMEKNEEITISYEQTPRIYLIIGIAERCRLLYLCSIRIE